MNTQGIAYIAPSSVVEGDVVLGEDCSVWHGAVIRGDSDAIILGARTNVQDNVVIHASTGYPCTVGEDVTIGHGAIVHGCSVGNNTLIGMGAIVLDGARVGSNCIVGAGSLVAQGKEVPDGTVVFGSPARPARRVKEADIAKNQTIAAGYVCEAQKVLPAVNVTHPQAHDKERTIPMNIRRATASDIPGISKLLLQVAQVHADGRPDLFMSGGTKYTDDELVGIIADDERPIFVAVDADETVLGYAFCVYEDYTQDTVRTHIRTLYIDDICVDEAARGRHVGRSVYEYVIAFAREQGFYNVTLNVWSCNPGAMRFYEAMGMKPYKVGMEQVL